MANFGHGGNIKEISRNFNKDWKHIIDFSANINPLGMPEGLREIIVNNLGEIEKYPDITYYDLKESIVDYENKRLNNKFVSSDKLILGNGAAEIIYNIVRGINPKRTMVLAPTFSEYEEAVMSISKEVVIYNLKEENNFNIDNDIIDEINEDINLLFICNPNNPTGSVTSKELLIRIVERAKKTKVIVAIDESFLDFISDDLSMIEFINKYDNLIIIKSLTKFFALPGLRTGYALCSNQEIIDKVLKVSCAWNVNILAEIATKFCLKDEKYITKTSEFIEKERNYLYNELKSINHIKVYKPSVNFIFFKIDKEIDLKQELLEKNILIRSCNNYHGLDETYFRIAVRTRKENISIVNALNAILHL